MKIRDYINKIIISGKQDDMEELSDMLDDLICDLKEQKPKLYKEYKRELYEIAYGNIILEDKAKEIVEHMRPYSEHYDMNDAKEVKDKYSIKHSISDVYLVINSLYNDYCDLIGDNDEMYAKMTKLWLNDTDSVDDKVYQYFMNVVKE